MKGMNPGKIKLSLDEMQIESFVTSIDSELAARLSGGVGNAGHPTHTIVTQDHEPGHICTGVQC